MQTGGGSASGGVGRTYLRRWIGAMTLNAATFEDVEADGGASLQAAITVLAAGLATGLGLSGHNGATGALWFGGVALLAWVSWALLTLQIGGKLLPQPATRVDLGQLLRTLGFAATPALLLVFASWPKVRVAIVSLTAIWLLLAMFAAVRHALDYTNTRRAIFVCVIGWLLAIGMVLGVGFFFRTVGSPSEH